MSKVVASTIGLPMSCSCQISGRLIGPDALRDRLQAIGNIQGLEEPVDEACASLLYEATEMYLKTMIDGSVVPSKWANTTIGPEKLKPNPALRIASLDAGVFL